MHAPARPLPLDPDAARRDLARTLARASAPANDVVLRPTPHLRSIAR
jgi:hypothetical protein